jgi:hypothetical protein
VILTWGDRGMVKQEREPGDLEAKRRILLLERLDPWAGATERLRRHPIHAVLEADARPAFLPPFELASKQGASLRNIELEFLRKNEGLIKLQFRSRK